MRLSPLMQRRIIEFRNHRLGFSSFVILMFLLIVSSCAELISNDKPLLIVLKGEVYVPFARSYSEKQFGGQLETEADYNEPVVTEYLRQHNAFVIWPVIPYSFDTVLDDDAPPPAAPSSRHWLGTDDQGRDVLARVIYGVRISLYFGLFLATISALIAIVIGGIQGYYGGKVDLILQRIIEIWSGLPVLYIIIILGTFVTPTFWWLLGLMLLFRWLTLVNMVRAEFLRARRLGYVMAAQAMGVGTQAILFRHILPNAMIAVITYFPFMINAGISLLTSLDFLGFGLPPGSPSLGELLAQGKNNLYAPWLAVVSFVTTALLLSLLIFIGEAVRSAFDPRKTVQVR